MKVIYFLAFALVVLFVLFYVVPQFFPKPEVEEEKKPKYNGSNEDLKEAVDAVKDAANTIKGKVAEKKSQVKSELEDINDIESDVNNL